MHILAGDIGGTNTRLALFDDQGRCYREMQKFPSKKFSTLLEIIQLFLQGQEIERACFGIAGPVEGRICRATNLPWIVDADQIEKHSSIEKVYLINDLLANAYGLNALKKEDFFTVNSGEKELGNQALISPGTGLGEAGMIYIDGEFYPFSSEGGHADFAPRGTLQEELLLYLKESYDHVSYERVLSGPGLANIYQFLVEKKGKKPLKKGVEEKKLPELITQSALDQSSEVALESIRIFLEIYGAEAGNVALKFLTLSGIYLGGGIIPHLVPLLKEGAFFKAFCNKGRFQGLLEKIPIYAVLNDQAALLGSLEYVLKHH